MRFTRFLTKEDKKKLEFEVVPQDLMVYLTRILRKKIDDRASEDLPAVVWQNMFVNMSHNLLEMPIYVLRADDWGMYHPAEQIWHSSEMDLVFRRLNTFQFIEMLCELVERGWFAGDEINPLFAEANLSFRIIDKEESFTFGEKTFSYLDEPRVEVISLDEISEEMDEDTHPNIRLLVDRMDRNLEAGDASAVLHTSATIFETLAKDIIASPNIENKTLGSFFEKYRKESKLPVPVLDYVLTIYNARSTTPLAGHGQTTAPAVSKEEAIMVTAMTKAFVKIEYQLRREALQVSSQDASS